MKKQTKRGFTIVELVIVIAIIAILAAILIPTFSNVIKRANISRDTQLIRNLNTALVVDSAKNGTHTTMQSALDAAEQFGYDVARINASATDNEILWDSVNDVFCYFNADSTEENKIEYIPDFPGAKETAPVDYWVISKTVNDTYSTYLFNYTDTSTADAPLVITTGLDVGNESVAYITYNGSVDGQSVVIRTNSVKTEVTINAANDIVKHYGIAGSVNVVKIAANSYHEYGQVPFIQVANGRIALEKEAVVAQIHLSKTNDEFNNIIIAKDTSVEMPVFSRDDVTIGENGTLVVALQDSTAVDASKDFVWLTKQGVFEQITISTSSSDAGTTYVDQVSSEEKQEAAHQIANNISSSVTIGETTYTVEVVDREVVVKQGETTVTGDTLTTVLNEAVTDTGITTEDFEEYKNETVNEASIEMGIDEYEYWIDIHSDSFAGGSGTVADPYQISNGRELALLAYYMTDSLERNNYKDKCYVLIADIDLSGKCWTPISNLNRKAYTDYLFSGTFDGQEHTITGLTNNGLRLYQDAELSTDNTTPPGAKGEYSYGLFGTIYNATLKNVNFTKVKIETGYGEKDNENHIYIGDSVGTLVGCINESSDNIVIENVHVLSGSVKGYDATGGIIGRGIGNGKRGTITSCSSAANVESIRRAGGLIGYLGYGEWTFSSCSFSGSVKCLRAQDFNIAADNGYYLAGAFGGGNFDGNISKPDTFKSTGRWYLGETSVDGFTNTGSVSIMISEDNINNTAYIVGYKWYE